MIVCHLHEQTCRFTGWANGKQNSGLVNCYRNRVYHLYKSVPFTEKQPRRPETGIKDGFEEMEHEFPSGTFRPEKTGLPFQMFRCSRIVSTGTT